MSTWYPAFLQAMFERPSDSDPLTGALKGALVTSSYTYSAAHDFHADLAGIIGTPVTLTSKSGTAGVLAATVPDYDGAELDGETAVALVLYIDTGSSATSRLVAYLDDAAVFPLLGEGEDQGITLGAMPLSGTTDGTTNDIWYPPFLEAFFTRPSNSDLPGGTVKAVLIDLADYTYSSAHDFLDDVPSGARVGTPQTIGTKTFTGGVFSGDNITFPSLTGDASEALLIYLDTGSEATSRLMCLKRAVQGLPITPIGTNETFRPNSTGGWMRLGATA